MWTDLHDHLLRGKTLRLNNKPNHMTSKKYANKDLQTHFIVANNLTIIVCFHILHEVQWKHVHLKTRLP